MRIRGAAVPLLLALGGCASGAADAFLPEAVRISEAAKVSGLELAGEGGSWQGDSRASKNKYSSGG